MHGKHFCDRLFALERDFEKFSSEERYEVRLKQSKPVMDEFFELAKNSGALPKTPVGQAVRYALDPYALTLS